MYQLTTHDDHILLIERALKFGGEGTVYLLQNTYGQRKMVAKIYHTHMRTPERLDKLIAMIRHKPAQQDTHISIAWPTHIVYNNGSFVGYTMPYIEDSNIIHKLMNFYAIRDYSHQFMYGVSTNLVHCIHSIHQKQHVIGDINERNFLVNRHGLVTLVDCDSIQIDDNGRILRCVVGVPEYTPSELHGISFDQNNRTVNHDYFGLAVMIFQLLVGRHPFAGRAINQHIDYERSDLYCIRQGIFPYIDNPSFTPPPYVPALDHLPPALQELFIKAFTTHSRPTTLDWLRVLNATSKTLTKCPNGHYYPSRCSCFICNVHDRLSCAVR